MPSASTSVQNSGDRHARQGSTTTFAAGSRPGNTFSLQVSTTSLAAQGDAADAGVQVGHSDARRRERVAHAQADAAARAERSSSMAGMLVLGEPDTAPLRAGQRAPLACRALVADAAVAYEDHLARHFARFCACRLAFGALRPRPQRAARLTSGRDAPAPASAVEGFVAFASHRTPPPIALSMRASTSSRGRSSMLSNSGGDTMLPHTATRRGWNRSFGLMSRRLALSARHASCSGSAFPGNALVGQHGRGRRRRASSARAPSFWQAPC